MAGKRDISAYCRAYYQKNRERILERAKQYYYAHREERISYQKEYNKEFLTSLSEEEKRDFYKRKNYKIKKI